MDFSQELGQQLTLRYSLLVQHTEPRRMIVIATRMDRVRHFINNYNRLDLKHSWKLSQRAQLIQIIIQCIVRSMSLDSWPFQTFLVYSVLFFFLNLKLAQFERDYISGELKKFVLECLENLAGNITNLQVTVENLPEEERGF